VSGFESLADGAGQIIKHDVEVNGLAQPRGEAGDHRLGVVTSPVETAVRANRPENVTSARTASNLSQTLVRAPSLELR
jgi:hypothetical protein